MSRSLPVAVVLAVLAITAPAQAEITGSTISTPADPHFVLIDPDAPNPPTVSIAGTATGSGSVDIVCVRKGVEYGDVFATNVPVANGTFSASDVPLMSQAGVRHPTSLEGACRLMAWPAGATPADPGAFSGPRLAVSKIARQRLNSASGPNDGVVFDANVLASGVGFSIISRPFGYLGINQGEVLDPATFRTATSGFYNSGGLERDPAGPRFSLQVDGQAAYPPAIATTGIGSTPTHTNPGLVGVKIDVTRFSPTTGALTVREINPLVRCAPDNAYPVTVDSCQRFVRVPVALERTTEFSRDNQVARVVDRWTSTDGRSHRLDLSLLQSICLGAGYSCSAQVAYRFPGEKAFAVHQDGTSIATAAGAIVARDVADAARGGIAVIVGQRSDAVRFRRDTYNDAFVLDYRARTIPATGSLTMSHTYVMTRSAGDIEALAAWLTPAPATQPHGATLPQPPAAPVISRRGHVRVLRTGRTFLVRTRDWVQCPAGGAACVVKVRGTRVRASQKTVAAGATARVMVKLNRRGVRALTRRGRLRLAITLSARAGGGAPLTRVRRLTVRRP
jgi:hypothetical protein